ncbi:MAG: alpha-N-arabinofuranosidase [Ruminococcaceae bacterium]|nr:alpha-N-arabinofuranosidase [Oscillospiraceae bacterium]
MRKAILRTDKYFKIDKVDERLFGSFLEHMGRAVYEGVYQPGNKFADENGIRLDTAALVKEMGVTAVRYPGGNIVSAYNWEDGVGPKELRPVRLEAAWQNLEDNSFGTNEFMDWTKISNTTPMMAVNLGTRGVEDAMHLLEYCNFPGGTYYSDLRKKHGYEKPHNVKLWCLGNEMDGPWQIGHRNAHEYGTIAAQTAKVMKDIDPSIELAACGSAGLKLPTFGEWDATVANRCFRYIDYLSMHTYYNNRNFTLDDTRDFLGHALTFDSQIHSVIAACDYASAINKSPKRINLSIDEWNVVYRPHGKVPPDARWTKAPHQIEDVYNLEDALLVGTMFLTMLNHADRVKIGCLAQLVNVIAPIMTSDNAAWKQTIFYPFKHCSNYGRGTALYNVMECDKYDSKNHTDIPYLASSVIYNEEEDRLAIFVVNRDLDEDSNLEVDLRQFKDYKLDRHIILNHDDIKAVNTEENPDNVVEQIKNENSKFENGCLTSIIEKHSWNVIVLKK